MDILLKNKVPTLTGRPRFYSHNLCQIFHDFKLRVHYNNKPRDLFMTKYEAPFAPGRKLGVREEVAVAAMAKEGVLT